MSGPLAIASLVTQTAGIGLTAGGIQKGARASRAGRRAIRREGIARLRDLYDEEQATLGTQRALYGAQGVDVESGSARLIQRETRDEFARLQALTAYMTTQREKGAQSAFGAQRMQAYAGMTSQLASMAQFAYGFQQGRARPAGNTVRPASYGHGYQG